MKRIEAFSSSQRSPLGFRFTRPVISAIAVISVCVLCVSGWTNTGAQQGGRDEIRIELSNNGFSPSEVQHAPGSFAIAVDNVTLSSDYKLRLKAEDGTVLHEVDIQKGSSAWSVSLQTGRYTLIEVNHSQWLCSIVVQ
jgi:hypothetical protein